MVDIYPNLKKEVGGSFLGCEIFSLLDIILVRWSNASCAMALACRPSIDLLKKKSLWKVWCFLVVHYSNPPCTFHFNDRYPLLIELGPPKNLYGKLV